MLFCINCNYCKAIFFDFEKYLSAFEQFAAVVYDDVVKQHGSPGEYVRN